MTHSSDNLPGRSEGSQPEEASSQEQQSIQQSQENESQTSGEATTDLASESSPTMVQGEETQFQQEVTAKTAEVIRQLEPVKTNIVEARDKLRDAEEGLSKIQSDDKKSGKLGFDPDAATRQLNNIPFESLIGGPLSAAIKAQGLAARETAAFLQSVGLEQDGKVRVIEFKYEGNGVDGKRKELTLKVPLLTLLPIPFLRIDDMSISFTAKINSSLSEDLSKENKNEASITAGVNYWFSKVNFQGGISNTTKTTSKSDYSVDYTMDVYVHATQDSIPSGLQAVMNTLMESINTKE